MGYKDILRTVFAGVIALSVCRYFHYHENYWLIFSALFTLQISFGQTVWRQSATIFACGLISACLVLFISLIKAKLFLAIILFIITAASVSVGLLNSELSLFVFFVTLFSMLAAGIPTVDGSLERFCFILLGALLAALLQVFCWPNRLRAAVYAALLAYLQALVKLQEIIFTIYLKRDYADRHYFYEKEIHEKQQEVLRASHQCKILLKLFLAAHRIFFQTIVKRLEVLHETMLALSLLRYRLKDYATLAVGEAELKNVLSASILSFQNAEYTIKKEGHLIDNTLLEGAIHAYENIYHDVLRVVAKDPVIFLFFINNLYSLQEGLHLLCTDITKLKNRK